MQKVLVENNADGTALITINREARRNAICAETAPLLQQAFQDFERSPTQKAAVITGAGNEAFSGGADTGNFPELWRCIPTVGFETNKPIVAAVANAVHNALGKRFYSLPMSPPKVLEVLDAEVQRAAE